MPVTEKKPQINSAAAPSIKSTQLLANRASHFSATQVSYKQQKHSLL
jgi:hypothetical protein